MRNEQDIRRRLADLQELLGYKMGYEDVAAIQEIRTKIEILEWVLGH
jgi:hypothetical protein